MGAVVAIAWTFLKSNWKIVAVGLAIAFLVGYIETLRLERDHYKSKAGELQLEIDTAKAEQAKETARLQLDFDAITAAHKGTLLVKGAAIMKGFDETLKRIKAHEPSKHIPLTPDVVELFNATTGPDSEPSRAIERNVREAGEDKTLVDQVIKENRQLSVTLNDLLVVSDENNAEHQKCIKQVEEWQVFWEKYVNARTLRHSN